MVSAHFNFPQQSTLVLPPSSINMANYYISVAQKRDEVKGRAFLVCSLCVRHLMGNPFASMTTKDPQFCICSMLANLIHFSPGCQGWVSRGVVLQKSCKPSYEPLSLSFSLSFPTPSFLFNTNWGSQPENELHVEVSADKREEADRFVGSCVPLSSVRRWICSRLRLTEMLCDINHIAAA